MTDIMTEKDFEALWQRAEAAEHATLLTAEYPVWRRNRRRAIGVMASLVAVVAVALPLFAHPQAAASDERCLVAYCNRPDTASQYWVDMADILLREA